MANMLVWEMEDFKKSGGEGGGRAEGDPSKKEVGATLRLWSKWL